MPSSAAVIVAVAHGSESLETVTLVNLLRRAEIPVLLASIEDRLLVDGTRGLRVEADAAFDADAAFAAPLLVLPGGEAGARALGQHRPLVRVLQARREAARPIAAICAAPALVLAANGLLDGVRATGYPTFRDRLPAWIDEPVVRDGVFTTSQGPGTAIAFALDLVEQLAGRPCRDRVAAGLLVA